MATQMAARLQALGYEVPQMLSKSGTPLSEFNPSLCDAVIIAVSDGAIADVLEALPPAPHLLWMHTSGSVGIEVFDPTKYPRQGVLYPLQTMLAHKEIDWLNVPLFIEGAAPEIEQLAKEMSPMVAPLNSVSRRRLHAAAVMSCNLVMYLWLLAREVTDAAGLDFALLNPLMEMSLQRALPGPHNSDLTGPARRGDLQTIASHLAVLNPEQRSAYTLLSNAILSRFNHPQPS